MSETKHKLDKETIEKLSSLVNFDPKKTYKFYPAKEGQVPEGLEPWI